MRQFLILFMVAGMLLSPMFLIFRHSLSGDASIYFTYIKNFFNLPFSFQPGTVAFGATSPLHVLLHAPVYRLAGPAHWLTVSKLLNLLLIPAALALLALAMPNRNWLPGLLILIAITALCRPLFIAASQLFETPLVLFALSLLWFLKNNRRGPPGDAGDVLVAGLLYLVRPELAAVTVGVDAYLLWRRRTSLNLIALSLLPTLTYHAYMFAMTGHLLPSSVAGRTLFALENPAAWGRNLARYLVPVVPVLGAGVVRGMGKTIEY